MSQKMRANPFDLVKASDFSDQQISQFWVDLAGESKLEDVFQPTLQMPMLLLGGKGSGKTHLMRYFSSAVRKISFGGRITEAVKADKYLSVYLGADALNVGRFTGKNISEEKWAAIFSYYFELWLATHLLKSVMEYLEEERGQFQIDKFIAGAKSLFLKPLPDSITSIAGLAEHFTTVRKQIGYVVSNVATGRAQITDIDICLSPGDLVFGLPALLVSCEPRFDKTLFIYMVDEIENFTETQQKFLHSLIRYRKGPVSLKIGARLYGIRTTETLEGADEQNRKGSEYQVVELDAFLREHSKAYGQLAKSLIAKRLQSAGFMAKNEITPENVDGYFEVLNPDNNFQEVACQLVRRFDENGNERPYFRPLIAQILNELKNERDATETAEAVVTALRAPKFPLLEKANVYLFYKTYKGDKRILETAEEIGEDCRKYLLDGASKAKRYAQTLDHFRSDFLAQLYRDCERPVVYAGLNTIIHLSQGVPRNLLGLLRHIYRRSHFAGEMPFEPEAKIGIESQNYGVRDAASWFWEDAQPDSYGPEARRAVVALAELFSNIRYSLKPAECDCATFTIAVESGTPTARQVLKHAENWSYLIKIASGGSDRNDKAAVDEKYQLSPMLSPRWGVSEHRRGAISLQEDLFNAIFDAEHRDNLKKLLRERLKGMHNPLVGGRPPVQNGLFE